MVFNQTLINFTLKSWLKRKHYEIHLVEMPSLRFFPTLFYVLCILIIKYVKKWWPPKLQKLFSSLKDFLVSFLWCNKKSIIQCNVIYIKSTILEALPVLNKFIIKTHKQETI